MAPHVKLTILILWAIVEMRSQTLPRRHYARHHYLYPLDVPPAYTPPPLLNDRPPVSEVGEHLDGSLNLKDDPNFAVPEDISHSENGGMHLETKQQNNHDPLIRLDENFDDKSNTKSESDKSNINRAHNKLLKTNAPPLTEMLLPDTLGSIDNEKNRYPRVDPETVASAERLPDSITFPDNNINRDNSTVSIENKNKADNEKTETTANETFTPSEEKQDWSDNKAPDLLNKDGSSDVPNNINNKPSTISNPVQSVPQGTIPLLLNPSVTQPINSGLIYLNNIRQSTVPNNIYVPITQNSDNTFPNNQQILNNNGLISEPVQGNVAQLVQIPTQNNLCLSQTLPNTQAILGNVLNNNGNLYAVVTVPANNVGAAVVPCAQFGNGFPQTSGIQTNPNIVSVNPFPNQFAAISNIPPNNLVVSAINLPNNGNNNIILNGQYQNASPLNGIPNSNNIGIPDNVLANGIVPVYGQNRPNHSSNNGQQLIAVNG